MVTIGALCLGLLGSALYTYTTLSRLHTQYLSNRGHEIAAAIEAQARGPGRRNNPAFWQSLFEESYETYSDSVNFLVLLDQNGKILAGRGTSSTGLSEIAASKGSDTFYFEEPLSRPRNPRGEASPQVAGWRIRIGLNTKDATFIRRQAYLQLAVSGLAVMALFALSITLLRTFNRFLVMKSREANEAGLKALGTMAASLAHEIRNPLGSMKGLTQLAQEDLSPDDAAQARLRTVVSEAERLERLVSDLLDFARRKEPQISEFDLADLLSEVGIMIQPRLEDAGATLNIAAIHGPLMIQSDTAGLRQILLNILINAVDATPKGGTISLSVNRDRVANSINIQIDDSGPGLGERDPEELFEPFVTTKARGTGLGLAVSRQIAESLGGSLTLENSPQGGARCVLRLPVRR
jgi:signal transduction histidine kinase